MKNLIVFMKKDKFNLVVAILSFVILALGWYLFSWWAGLIAFVLVNLIWIVPFIQWSVKLDKREKVRELEEHKFTQDIEDEPMLERRDDDLAKRGKKSKKKSDKKTLGKKILHFTIYLDVMFNCSNFRVDFTRSYDIFPSMYCSSDYFLYLYCFDGGKIRS